MEKKYYKNLKMIVCVGKDNLIGDRTPDENSNGMLWHIKEELMYFKERTMGNTVLFGGTTAKYVPVELMRKNREVIVLHRTMDVPKLIDNRFMRLRGNDKIIPGQLINLPIIKTDEDTVQVVSNYNKIFITIYGQVGKINQSTNALIRALNSSRLMPALWSMA